MDKFICSPDACIWELKCLIEQEQEALHDKRHDEDAYFSQQVCLYRLDTIMRYLKFHLDEWRIEYDETHYC